MLPETVNPARNNESCWNESTSLINCILSGCLDALPKAQREAPKIVWRQARLERPSSAPSLKPSAGEERSLEMLCRAPEAWGARLRQAADQTGPDSDQTGPDSALNMQTRPHGLRQSCRPDGTSGVLRDMQTRRGERESKREEREGSLAELAHQARNDETGRGPNPRR